MKRNLPGWAIKILRSLAEVVMPHGDDFKVDLIDYSVDFIDRYVGYFPTYLRLLFPLGLVLLQFGPAIYMGKLVTFTNMPMEDKERYVAGWIDSSSLARRDLIKGVKGLVMVAYYSHPKVMDEIGYDLESHISAAVSRGGY